jgi:hypothetical protein
MWLEDFETFESADNGVDWQVDSWTNTAKEAASEKASEKAKKSAAWIKRTIKDESKAKKCDSLLYSFLIKIVKDKKYDFLLEDLFSCLDEWYPSNFLVWLLSIIYLPISDRIREKSWKEKIEFNYISKELKEFNDLTLDPQIKTRINLWVEDIVDILSIEYSSLLTERLIQMFWKDEYLLKLTSKIFAFFFQEININITAKKAEWLSQFILKEVYKKLKTLEIEEI